MKKTIIAAVGMALLAACNFDERAQQGSENDRYRGNERGETAVGGGELERDDQAGSTNQGGGSNPSGNTDTISSQSGDAKKQPVDATGQGSRFRVISVDDDAKIVRLEPMAGSGAGAEKQQQAGRETQLTFDELEGKFGAGKKVGDLEEGQVIGVYRDEGGKISRVIVEEQGGK